MYESYFGLIERPFSIAPDPQYLYMSARHKEAMAHLSYGLSQGGCFIVLTGEVGTGKTTLFRNLMTDLPDNVDVALVLNANISEKELLQTVCDELKIEHHESDSQKRLLDLINEYLLSSFAKRRHTVLIIDEAQLLSRDVLEQVRLLTNLETTKVKLLQIILIGQPELSDLLSRNDLRQLAQRVTARYHLGALQRSEIQEYVNYRLGVAGCKQPLFSKQALSKLHQLSDGIPRKINVLADHALLSAYSQSQRMVDSKHIKKSASEVFFSTDSSLKKHIPFNRWWLLAFGLIALNVLFWWFFLNGKSDVESTAARPAEALVEIPEQAQELSNVSDLLEPEIALQESVDVPGTQTALQQAEQAAEQVVDPLLEQSLAQVEPAATPLVAAPGVIAEQSVEGSGKVIVSTEYLDADETEPAGLNGGDLFEGAIAALPVERVRKTVIKTEFTNVLETSADLTGRVNAYRELVQLWNETLPEQIIKPLCVTLNQAGLECTSVDNWERLLRYNRPAILVLNHQEQLHRVVVEVVDGDAAEVRIGSNIYRISVDELQSLWLGDGVFLWRPSDVGMRFLQPSDNNSNVPDVRGYLNRALAQAQLPILRSIDDTEFDSDMSQKVFALQSTYGIISDSAIGIETYLLMNELVSPQTTPLLKRRAP